MPRYKQTSAKSKFKVGKTVKLIGNRYDTTSIRKVIGFDSDGDPHISPCPFDNKRGGWNDSNLIPVKRSGMTNKKIKDLIDLSNMTPCKPQKEAEDKLIALGIYNTEGELIGGSKTIQKYYKDNWL